MIETLIAFTAVVLMILAIFYLVRLESRVRSIEERANKVRRTNADLDAFDDIMAVAVRTVIEDEMQSEVRRARIKQLERMLSGMRNLESDKKCKK